MILGNDDKLLFTGSTDGSIIVYSITDTKIQKG